ncbi:MAG: hypothetical protein ACPG77_19215 [Nannocystaceae bacterium]
MENSLGLSKVRLKKSDLLTQLRHHYQMHIREYTDARNLWQENYRTKLIELVQQMDNPEFEYPETIDVPDCPTDNRAAYEHVISLLEASLDTEIVLASSEFAKYYNDEWHWKAYHNETYARLSSTARAR